MQPKGYGPQSLRFSLLAVCLGERNSTACRDKVSAYGSFYNFSQLKFLTENAMNNVIYIVGLIVIVLAILKFAGII
jgi:hypothetical protein